jgi:CubicO group peptidase (beta-lactamase class C family)
MSMIQKRSAPEAQGIPTGAIKRFIDKLGDRKIPIHSLLVARHGYLVAEAYYAPYKRDVLHRMFSETKSFTSLAIGLLESDGTISLQDKICDYFPEYLPGKVHPWMAEMTIENLLMMETCHSMTTYKKNSTTKNWVRSFFQTPPSHRPGTIFMYDTSASHVLCALVEKLTGLRMLDFLKRRVLRSIGFSADSYVILDPFGTSMGGTGLMAKPIDMLRVGLMLMNGGRHPDDYKKEEARQVYPKKYLDCALTFKTPTVMSSDTDTGYGYQFWRLPYGGYGMLGMGGQDTLCFPQQDMVFVFTADMQGIPNGTDTMLYDLIGEVFEYLSDIPLEVDKAEQKAVRELIGELELPTIEGLVDIGDSSEVHCQEDINGKDFFFYANPNGFKHMKVVFETETKGYLEYENRRGVHRITFGLGRSEKCMFPEYNQMCVSSAAWCDTNTFYIRTWLVDESVASIHFKLAFHTDGGLTVLMKKTEETKFNEYQGMLNGS